MKKKYLSLLSLSGFLICLDQLAKNLAIHSLLSAEIRADGVNVIPRFMTLRFSTNTGFAFGLLERAPSSLQDVFFIGIPVFALVLIVLIFIKLKDSQWGTGVALVAILSGAVGNLIDRIQYGYVIDFLDFHFGEAYHFPPLNFADLSILLGVLLMFYTTVLHPPSSEMSTST